MSIAFLPDLKASRELLRAINIVTPFRDYSIAGVKDVNEDDEYVVMYTSRPMGDRSTTTTVLLSDVVSATLYPDTGYEMGRGKHQPPAA